MGLNVVIGAADTFRAAAIDQLVTWAERVNVPIVKQQMGSDPASVAFDTLNFAKSNNADVVLIDTAGRLHNKVNLMNELSKIKRVMDKLTAATMSLLDRMVLALSSEAISTLSICLPTRLRNSLVKKMNSFAEPVMTTFTKNT